VVSRFGIGHAASLAGEGRAMVRAVPAESTVVRIEFARRIQHPAETTSRVCRSIRLLISAVFSEPKVVLRHLS
jgi:hypothetical protein